MSRIVPIHYRKLVRVLEMEGFTYVRERGDHMIFGKARILRPLVVPRYDPLPVFIIKERPEDRPDQPREILGTVKSRLAVSNK